MNLSCSSKTIKYLMFAFNLFFVISGIIIIAVGAAVKTVYREYADFLGSQYFTLPNMLIATGAFIFIISFFGCCGAIKESWILLGIFSILLCIIFIFEFACGIAGYVLRDQTEAYLETTLRSNLPKYENMSKVWDLIQNSFECCGVTSYEDWKDQLNETYALPLSCCSIVSVTNGAFYCNSYIPAITTTVAPTEATTPKKPGERRKRDVANGNVRVEADTGNNGVTPSNPSTSSPHKIGCKSAFGDYVRKHAVQIGGCALGLAIVQILGIAFSCHLVRQLKNGYYST